MKYNVENPDITQLNEIMKKYVNIYKKTTTYIKFIVCYKL